MCNPGARGSAAAMNTMARPGVFAPASMQQRQQYELKRKPLTAQEREQQRSETAAWTAMGNTAETSPYRILPQSRIAAMRKIPKRQMGQRGMY